MPIRLALCSQEVDFKDIKKVYSHPQALSQSDNWLRQNLPHADLVPVQSTSKAAEIVSMERGSACVGHQLLAQFYKKLNLVETDIEDRKENTTRFVLIACEKMPIRSDRNITTIIISLKDRPGALLDILKHFANEDITLTNIVSRPSKRKAFDYIFFIDFLGDEQSEHVKRALDAIGTSVTNLKILGSYPSGRDGLS